MNNVVTLHVFIFFR